MINFIILLELQHFDTDQIRFVISKKFMVIKIVTNPSYIKLLILDNFKNISLSHNLVSIIVVNILSYWSIVLYVIVVI
jgi:hypothetical protein